MPLREESNGLPEAERGQGKMSRVFFLIVAGLVLALGASASARAEKPVIVIGTAADEPTWPPAMPHDDVLWGFVSRPVVALDKDNKWYCYLCVELPERVEEPVKGDMWNLRFRLTGVWGDMDPLAAEDLIAGLEYLQSAAKTPAQKELLGRIERIQAIPSQKGEVLVTVRGSEDVAMLALAHLYPLHSIKTAAPAGAAAAAAMRTTLTDARWYLGPYFLKANAATRAWELAPAEPSLLATLEVRFYQNPQSLKERFLEGAVDIIPHDGLPRDLQRQLLAETKGEKVVTQPGYLFEHIDLNLRNPVFIDRNVRQALALAVDRQVLAKEVGLPLVTLHNGAWIATTAETPQWFEPNIEEAKQRLKIAGWESGKDGKRERDGTPLSLPLTFPAGDETRKLVAQQLAEMWGKLGVEVTLEQAPKEDFYDFILTKTRFRGVSLYAWRLQPFVVPVSPFHSSEIPLVQNDYTGQNISSWQNRNADQAIEKWNAAPREDFAAAAAHFQTLYREDVPQIPLFLWNEIVFVQSRVKGVHFPSRLAASSFSAAQWTLQPLQKGSVKP